MQNYLLLIFKSNIDIFCKTQGTSSTHSMDLWGLNVIIQVKCPPWWSMQSMGPLALQILRARPWLWRPQPPQEHSQQREGWSKAHWEPRHWCPVLVGWVPHLRSLGPHTGPQSCILSASHTPQLPAANPQPLPKCPAHQAHQKCFFLIPFRYDTKKPQERLYQFTNLSAVSAGDYLHGLPLILNIIIAFYVIGKNFSV